LKDQIYTESGRSIAEKRHHFLENFFIQLLEEIQCKG
jgi:HD superfamily phosphodiesterase